MSHAFHKAITLVLAIVAILTASASYIYYDNFAPDKIALSNPVWEFKHRGYPSQFGYLSHQWGLRIIEIHSQFQTDEHHATQAIEFKMFDDDGLLGEFILQFDLNWQADGHKLDVSVIDSTIEITSASDGFDLDALHTYLYDMVHNMYQVPREVISVSHNMLIIDIPYVGIIRLTPTPTAHLIRE